MSFYYNDDCILVSSNMVGDPFPNPFNPPQSKSYGCREERTCPCPNGPGNYQLGCHGEYIETITYWLAEVENCYECPTNDGCIYKYCEKVLIDLGPETTKTPCDALTTTRNGGCNCNEFMTHDPCAPYPY